jgi:hypothetical protein
MRPTTLAMDSRMRVAAAVEKDDHKPAGVFLRLFIVVGLPVVLPRPFGWMGRH